MSDLQDAFIKRIERMMSGFDEGRVVFDRYLENSLKNKTRQKRSTTSVEFQVHPEMRLTMSIKDLLSSSKSKSQLVTLFSNGLLARFSSSTTVKLVVVHENKIKCLDCEEEHTHEEADTLIPNQVLRSLDEHVLQEICVSSPDTDVLVLLLDLVSRGRHGNLNGLKFLTGKGPKYRAIDVIQRVQAIGVHKCQGLIGLHHFTGADWRGKFVGITKKTWVKAYMALDVEHPVINCFRELGDRPIQNQLANGELPTEVKELEKFVCQVYCKAGPTNLPELRWELFRSRNLEGEMLPPTRSALLPHITRANFMAMCDKSYTVSCPDQPPIKENGWNEDQGAYIPVTCLSLPAPQAVIELTKCGCKSDCKGRCSCFKNGLPCTPLCKCFGKNCTNPLKEDTQVEDEDEDDDALSE